MKTISPQLIRQTFILAIILLLGLLIFLEMSSYLSGILGAIIIYVLLRRPMQKLVKLGWPKTVAAIALMVGSFVCILVPITGLGFMISSKVQYAVDNSQKVITATKDQLENIESYLNMDLASSIDTDAMTGWISQQLQQFAGGTFSMFLSLVLMYFLLFYMLINEKRFRNALINYIPIQKTNLKSIGAEVSDKVKANALGIPLVAIGQGLVALVGFLIFDTQDPFFWSAIVTIGSMIPFVGSLLGVIPVFLLTLSSGDMFQAWGVLLYGFVIVGATDNILRLFVLKHLDQIHPLITLTGVLVGVPLFGFVGLIFGPLIISLFLIILDIYKKEYGYSKDKL
ncbi:AI-2E family transporter [uncultured Winogradskyella sp.]|uniref:AI-2E family transporter n=1 Tax=uncultured Winogradskyella sp. TaxID=395353 RepID=UPI00351773D4